MTELHDQYIMSKQYEKVKCLITFKDSKEDLTLSDYADALTALYLMEEWLETCINGNE